MDRSQSDWIPAPGTALGVSPSRYRPRGGALGVLPSNEATKRQGGFPLPLPSFTISIYSTLLLLLLLLLLLVVQLLLLFSNRLR